MVSVAVGVINPGASAGISSGISPEINAGIGPSPGTGPATSAPGGVQILAQASVPAARRHAETLAPLLEQVLAQAQRSVRELEQVIVGTGPGPFTGLRVGLATAQALGLARGIPVVGVCSMDALALAACQQGVAVPGRELVIVTDALRREVHVARYEVFVGDGVDAHGLLERAEVGEGGSAASAAGARGPASADWGEGGASVLAAADLQVRRVQGPQVCDPATLTVTPNAVVVGAGAQRYRDPLPASVPGGQAPWDPPATALIDWVARGYPSGPALPLYLRRPDVTIAGSVVPA